jgi:hypothetical protein
VRHWDEGPVKLLDLVADEVVEYSWREPDSGNVVRLELDGSGGHTHTNGFDGRDTSGYQLGWRAFLSTLRRMLELGDGWRKSSSSLSGARRQHLLEPPPMPRRPRTCAGPAHGGGFRGSSASLGSRSIS